MLRALNIRGMLFVDELELEFRPGLNVLTGETGAGKSILLDALGFALGWRGRSAALRRDSVQGEVVAEFELPDCSLAHALLAEAGLPGGEFLLLRRTNTSDKRNPAWINDRRVSARVLRSLGESLVEMHGQHDDRGLLDQRGHRGLLDGFAGAGKALAATREAWDRWRRAVSEMNDACASLTAARKDEVFLRHAVAELDRLDPQLGEDAELDARRRFMQQAERIRDDVARALALLGDEGAERAVGDAIRWLEAAVDHAEGALDEPVAALSRALIELGDAVQGIGVCLERLAFDPQDLEAAEERLFSLRALARKHGVAPDGLVDVAHRLRESLADLDTGVASVSGAEGRVNSAWSDYDAAATSLSEIRHGAAAGLGRAVMAELAPLRLGHAIFETSVTDADPGPDGRDRVVFTVTTNPGAPAGPLNLIGSGGELSRFLLALKVCLHGDSAGKTLVFDEIDRGVGGATADAVGRRLAAISQASQVLAVTHSPQVAALGHHHWRVAKRMGSGGTDMLVEALGADARVAEIARMLAGNRVTEEARAAARALLADPGTGK